MNDAPFAKHIELACQHIVAGETNKVLDLVNPLIREEPTSPALWTLRGHAYFLQKRWTKARDAFEHANTYGRLDAESRYQLAECYVRLDCPESAACIYEHLMTQLQHLPVRYFPNLAARLGTAGKSHFALEVCRQAARLNPDCDQAAFGVAYYMSKTGCLPGQVIPVLQRAISLAPDVLHYRITLAQLNHRCGRSNVAYQLLAQMQVDDIAGIKCQRCISQLWQIFELAKDYRRCNWCRARLQSEDVS